MARGQLPSNRLNHKHCRDDHWTQTQIMPLDRLIAAFLALVVALPLYARAETDEVPPLPDRKPAHVETPVLPGDQPTIPWTDAEITAAKADCDKALKGIALDYEALPPIKEGVCGAPAPILVKSIGGDPKVAIDPPATMTCALAAGLASWLKNKVQPEAKAQLATEVVKLKNASSYVCRNRYGGADTPLSEHALANALDVSEFVFASGAHVTVLDGWPRAATVASNPPAPSGSASTSGSITKVAQVATPTSLPVAARESAIFLTRIKANPFELPVLPKQAKPPKVTPVVRAAPAGESLAAKAKSNPFVVPAAAEQSAPDASGPAPQPGTSQASATAQDAAPKETLAERESIFIKEVHDDACEVFGTTLGPEANDAHKNHFHLDMKARRHAGLCD